MRNYLVLCINGKEFHVKGEDAFLPLSTFLRYGQKACGTKVVCEEGDCGACSIILGKVDNTGENISYKAVNSCIQYMYQLDLAHVITIEGLKPNKSNVLNLVQKAMVDCHGAQCGYCTPGFVTTLCNLLDEKSKLSEIEIKDGLTGNLCRCTGYESIIKAGLSLDNSSSQFSLNKLFPDKSILEKLTSYKNDDVQLEFENKIFFSTCDLKQAVKFRAEHNDAIVIAGGTDVCVNMNKRSYEPKSLLSLARIKELSQIKQSSNILEIGANVTLTEIEKTVKELLPQWYDNLILFGSPQIRNAGTLVGNIANASPISDNIPLLSVLDAIIEVVGPSGTRQININNFYKGYKKLDLASHELITKVLLPLPDTSDTLKLYKVSKRKHMDISTFTAAILLKRKNNKIELAKLAYGGVGPVVYRLAKTEAYLLGKDFSLSLFEQAGDIAVSEITPISDVRGSLVFRNLLAKNILLKFYHECADERELVCQK
jgi:xanthine dehydrogenase small subunit